MICRDELDPCGEACGCEGKIDCRVWVYQGQEYTVAPVPLIVDAILSAVRHLAQEPGCRPSIELAT